MIRRLLAVARVEDLSVGSKDRLLAAPAAKLEDLSVGSKDRLLAAPVAKVEDLGVGSKDRLLAAPAAKRGLVRVVRGWAAAQGLEGRPMVEVLVEKDEVPRWVEDLVLAALRSPLHSLLHPAHC